MTNRKPALAWILVSLCVVSAVVWAAAVESPPLKPGLWEGTISRPNGEKPVSMVLTSDGTAWSGTADFPAAGAIGVPLAEVEINGASASFIAPGVPGQPSFKGTIAAGGASIAGTFKQGAGSFPFKLTWKGEAPLPLKVVDGAKLQGIWEGRTNAGILSTRMIFRVASGAEGALSATMSVPDEGSPEIPVNGIGFLDPKVRFVIAGGAASYEGTLGADGRTLTGTFNQVDLGIPMPLVLNKVERATELKRPQEPKRPFPYEEIEVSYRNDAAGITLAGALTLPRGAGPFPAVVLITGSGAEDRDETILGHKPFLLLADYLTRKGIAVLRVDDRGVGGSGGDQNGTTADFAGDVQAGVRFLVGRKDINPERIGLIGHSEGGLIAPMVASNPESGVAFIVLLAGPGVTGGELAYEQGALAAAAAGAPREALTALHSQQESAFAVLKAGGDIKVMQQKLRDLGIQQTDRLLSPWFRLFLTYDPRPALSKVKVPVLALIGALDQQVPPAQNVPALEATLKSGLSKDHQVRVLPGLNHMFQTSSTGLPEEYGLIEETMSPVALQAIADWVVARTH